MGKYIHFSEEFLESVRSKVSLHELISGEVALKKMGGNFVAKCPFHEEKTASFTISSTKNTYRCYGCGAYGDVVSWLRYKHHLSFHDSVVRLAVICGLSLPYEETSSEEDKVKRRHLAGLYQTLKEAHKIYCYGLSKNQFAQDYLKKDRGLLPETIAQFELGVVGSGVTPFINKNNSVHLIASGLAIEKKSGEIYDRFRYRIMFPIHNEYGNLIGMAGRTFTKQQEKFPKYINSPETEVFHKSQELYGLHLAKTAIHVSDVAVIVEGYFDVLSLHQAGEKRAVASMGTSITQHQINRILHHANTLIFVLDGDQAGRKAVFTMLPILLGAIEDKKKIKILSLPDGDDPDSFIRKQGISGWLSAVENAMPLSMVLTDYVISVVDIALPEGQVAAAEKAKEMLACIQKAELFRLAMQRKFESVIGLSFD